MSKLIFNLQRFAGDDDIVIPEEFEGIDRDIAIELMRENGLLDDTAPENDKKTDVTPKTSESPEGGDQPTTTKDPESDGNAAPVKEPETDDKGTGGKTDDEPNKDGDNDTSKKTVPYGALIDERGKRKAAQREVESLKGEIERLRQQQQNPISQPIVQPVQHGQPSQATTPPLDDIVEQAALQLFTQKYGREPDDLDRGDNIKLASCTYEINRNIENYQRQQQRATEEARQQAQSFWQFSTEQQQKDDFEEVQASLLDELKNMSPEAQQAFRLAYGNCEQGRGTAQDVFLVKKFWNEARSKYQQSVTQQQESEKQTEPSKNEPAPPPKPKTKTAEEKLSEIEKQPKANLVKGTQSKPVSVEEIARLMNEMPWEDFEKKYPEYAKLVLEG